MPNCPYGASYIDVWGVVIHNPAISITNIVLSIVCAGLGSMTFARFHHLKLFNRLVTHPTVSNSPFSYFFFTLSLCFALDGLRYAIDTARATRTANASIAQTDSIVQPHVIDAWLLVSSCLLRSIAVLLVTVALNRQLKHRSGCKLYISLFWII